jgi:DtxR family Mn-dependent transcriptional regulator
MDRIVEEVLEFIWTEREAGRSSISALLAIAEVMESGADMRTIKEMERMGLVGVKGDAITLTPEGERAGKGIIRRHRLAERLFTEVLALDANEAERTACGFEHTLSADVADNICTLLAHPPTCPHDLPIPRGACCERTASTIEPLVVPLSSLDIGKEARIIFIVPTSHARLDRLGAMGIMPGSTIRLHQKKPSYVIEIGETTLALDPEIASEIYVKKASMGN